MNREIEFIFIRHGRTNGNAEGRYIGCRTDEALSEAGISQLRAASVLIEAECMLENKAVKLYSGPMKRCRQTAEILFPHLKADAADGFTEIDFGDFEGMTYSELNDRPEYQRWIDSGGEIPFPNGEAKDKFICRSIAAFYSLLADAAEKNVVVCHDGNIMAIMSELTGGDYFSFHTHNGEGIALKLRLTGDSIDVLSYHSIHTGISA